MKFPIAYQSDSMLCGITCLQMICKFFGKQYSANYIEKLCFATHEGVSLLGISYAAEKLGFYHKSIKTTIKS